MITTSEYARVISEYIECMESEELAPVFEQASEAMLDAMKLRIFDEGIATNGQPITAVVLAEDLLTGSVYSVTHGEARAEAGLQTDYVDLNFTGNLRESMQLFKQSETGKVSLGFVDEESGNLSLYLEEYRQLPIFAVGDTDAEVLFNVLDEELPFYLKECLESKI